MHRPNLHAMRLFFVLLMTCGLAGCQSTAPAPASAGRSVTAGKTTFIEVTGGQGSPQVIAYTEPGQPVCPECRSVAEDYFKTGVLDERTCKTCGATFLVGRGQIMQP